MLSNIHTLKLYVTNVQRRIRRTGNTLVMLVIFLFFFLFELKKKKFVKL